MNDLLIQNPALYFPIFFALLWLGITTLLGLISGWFSLMRNFPDREEAAIRKFTGLSGSMNLVGMHSVLTISVCPGGLRLAMTRLLGPFNRNIFVPWDKIEVIRKDRFLWKSAQLRFGQPAIGALTIPAEVADCLARVAGSHWTELGPFPEESSRDAATRIAIQWAAATTFAAIFFSFGPRLLAPPGARAASVPVAVAVFFPAVVFGVAAIFRYLRRPRS
jgi:hypothetical protein